MSLPSGKGLMAWKAANYKDGSLITISQACAGMGLSWIALKIGDGANVNYATFPGAMQDAVNMFHDIGMLVIGWQYVYGGVWYNKLTGTWMTNGTPAAQEAEFAKYWVDRLGLDGYWIDAEKEYKLINQAERAKSFMAALSGIKVPVGLCSYRFPSLHPEFPFREFLSGCQMHVPQVYHGKDRAVIDLERSYKELIAYRNLPYIPIGRAYIGDGYASPGPAPYELIDLMSWTKYRGHPAVGFWALDFLHLHTNGPEREAAISGFQWGDAPPPVQPPIITPDEPKVEQPIGKVRITTYVLNVRTGAGIGYSDKGDLWYGTEWYVFEVSGDWGRVGVNMWVRLGDGFTEWI